MDAPEILDAARSEILFTVIVLVPAAALAVSAEYRLNITPVVVMVAAPSLPVCENKNTGKISRHAKKKIISKKVLVCEGIVQMDY